MEVGPDNGFNLLVSERLSESRIKITVSLVPMTPELNLLLIRMARSPREHGLDQWWKARIKMRDWAQAPTKSKWPTIRRNFHLGLGSIPASEAKTTCDPRRWMDQVLEPTECPTQSRSKSDTPSQSIELHLELRGGNLSISPRTPLPPTTTDQSTSLRHRTPTPFPDLLRSTPEMPFWPNNDSLVQAPIM